MWLARLKKRLRIKRAAAWGRLDPIALCYRGPCLFPDIYHRGPGRRRPPHPPKTINGKRKQREGRLRTAPKRSKNSNARQHLTPIAAHSLCVPLSHWYFEAMHSTITRTPRSNARDVIEVPSLQAAADAVLDCAGFPRLFMQILLWKQ